ncbi:MAG: alpha-L-fucosidase [Balneolaceae bacterium]
MGFLNRFSLLFILVLFISCIDSKKNTSEKLFEESWESLASNEKEPEWFKDAKLGIYFHWGVYSVPAYSSEWYPRWMYVPYRDGEWGGDVYEHHEATYGGVSEFNYHDFISDFTGEFFDAKEWATLFEETGAKFAGPVAQHHDGFAMWESAINPWNAKNMGPKSDILGELYKELKERELKTIATFHHAKLLQRYASDSTNWADVKSDPGQNSHYPYHPDLVTSSRDKKLRLLYGNMEENEFLSYWLNQVNEVVDNYQPDIIWFDSWLDQIPESYRKKMVAHHFNSGIQNNQQPIVAYKQEDLPKDVGILDIEQGGKTNLSEDYWLTDITLSYGAWNYVNGQTYKDSKLLIRNMIDVWSKRGIVLLNISPTSQGIIPDEQRIVLKEIGAWIKEHEEAVYETRAYSRFGYGEAEFEAGHFGGQSATIKYGSKDIRFSRSKDGRSIFVYALGLPETNGNIDIRYVLDSEKEISSVSLLGSNTKLNWETEGDLLKVETPSADKMNEIATVFKIELK